MKCSTSSCFDALATRINVFLLANAEVSITLVPLTKSTWVFPIGFCINPEKNKVLRHLHVLFNKVIFTNENLYYNFYCVNVTTCSKKQTCLTSVASLLSFTQYYTHILFCQVRKLKMPTKTSLVSFSNYPF